MKDFDELFKRGALPEAEQLCLALASANPNAPEPLTGLIKICRSRRDFAELQTRLEQFIALFPNAIDERANLLHLRGKQGDLAGVRAALPELEALYLTQKFDRPTGQRLLELLQFSLVGSDRLSALLRLRDRVESLVGDRPGLIERLRRRLDWWPQNRSSHVTSEPNEARQFKALLACLQLALDDHESFVKTVAKLCNRNTKVSIYQALHRVRDKIVDPRFGDHKAHKIIGLGLSRTGTSSLNSALNVLGYHSIHWKNPLTGQIIGPSDIPLFDGFTDISLAHQFEDLYDAYPNAKFILTTRNVESWDHSVRAHYLRTTGCEDIQDLRQHPLYQDTRTSNGQVFWALYGQHESWRDAYTYHLDRVRGFFRDKPEGRYLEIAITEGQGYERLCAFLQCPVPSHSFPNVNARPMATENPRGEAAI